MCFKILLFCVFNQKWTIFIHLFCSGVDPSGIFDGISSGRSGGLGSYPPAACYQQDQGRQGHHIVFKAYFVLKIVYLAIKKVPINFAPPDHTSCQSTPHLQDGDTSRQLAINLGSKPAPTSSLWTWKMMLKGRQGSYLNPVIAICRALDNHF